MASITIPDIDTDLKERLEKRAVQHGHSIEAEVQSILRAELGPKPPAPPDDNLADAIRAIVEPLGGVELKPLPRQPVREPPNFE